MCSKFKRTPSKTESSRLVCARARLFSHFNPKFSQFWAKKGQNQNFRFFSDFGPKTLLMTINEL